MENKISSSKIKKELIKNHGWEELNWLYPAAYDKLIKDTIKIIKKELVKL